MARFLRVDVMGIVCNVVYFFYTPSVNTTLYWGFFRPSDKFHKLNGFPEVNETNYVT